MYCTIDDIEKHTSSPTLIQLSSDDGQEAVNRVVVEEAILYASTLIDGYLRGRYSLPLDTHFPLLRIIAIDLSVYRLYSRRMRNEMPEVIETAYKSAIAQGYLSALNDGNKFFSLRLTVWGTQEHLLFSRSIHLLSDLAGT